MPTFEYLLLEGGAGLLLLEGDLGGLILEPITEPIPELEPEPEEAAGAFGAWTPIRPVIPRRRRATADPVWVGAVLRGSARSRSSAVRRGTAAPVGVAVAIAGWQRADSRVAAAREDEENLIAMGLI